MALCKICLLLTFGAAVVGGPALAATGIQVGPSGKSYASSALRCMAHPLNGMSPMVDVGLYDPKRNASAKVFLNGSAVASITFFSPDANVWLINGSNLITVALSKRSSDTYMFDATASEENYCLPDTTRNFVVRDMEYAASNSLYATTYASIFSDCAKNPLSGRWQPFVTLYDNSISLFDVSVNNAPLGQLSESQPAIPVFLSPGWNVISAVNAGLSIVDYYVRDGGDGNCTSP